MNSLPGERFVTAHRERLSARGRLLSFLLRAGLALGASLIPGAAGAVQNNLAAYVELTGLIDPASAESLVEQIEGAERAGASALIVRLDTPGAVGTDVHRLVRAVVGSPIPVVIWVGPGDARAAGAGMLLTMAAHYSAMTPAATLGPAHPIDLKSYEDGDRSTRRSRSADALLELIDRNRRGVEPTPRTEILDRQVGAAAAQRLGVVDSTTGSIPQLLQGLKGRSLIANGRAVTLSDEPFTLRFMKMGLLERLLHGAARPEAAYLLLLVGAFGLIFELYNPGVGAAALAGGVALGFGVYALTVLPTSWLGAALIGAGFGFLVLDLRTNRLGLYSALGFAAILTGSLRLFAGVDPSLRLPWWAVAAGLAATAIFFVSIMTSALAARAAKPLVGMDGLVGSIGVARTDISPEGQVMARGTLWRAQTMGAAIGRGTPIKVMAVRGLILMVEPAEEIAPGS